MKKKLVFKSKSFVILFLIFSIVTALIAIQSCSKKDGECRECKKELVPNTTVNLNGKLFSSYSDNYNPKTILISKSECENITALMRDIVKNIGITQVNMEYPVALCLYFKDSVNTDSFNGLLGVLIYNKVNSINYVTFLKKEKDNSFSIVENLSGIGNLVSKIDILKINEIMGFNSKQLLLLLDQSKLPSNQYPSVFQVKVIVEYNNAKENGGGSQSWPCNANPDCGDAIEGYCYYKERQNGPVKARCNTLFNSCSTLSTEKKLSSAGYIVNKSEIDAIYKIRNLFLIKSTKGQQYIDDYYYASELIKGNISMPLALKFYELCNKSFFTKLSQFDNPIYNDSIIIDNTTKQLLLDICQNIKHYSNDDRFNSIVSKVINDINLYSNKTLSEIKKDFQ